MADVKVVINIPEEQYVATKVLVENYNKLQSNRYRTSRAF